MSKIYTGVGSRETPEQVLLLMRELGKYLANRNWTLRTGGATGADSAFADGRKLALAAVEPHAVIGDLELYLPWDSFQGIREIESVPGLIIQAGPSNEAYAELSEVLEPSHLARLSQAGHKLHARNCHQVLGQYFGPEMKARKTTSFKSSVVICWTLNGRPVGGTATAIKLARRHHIPVLNLGHREVFDLVWNSSENDLESVIMGAGNHDLGLKL